jgi:hypothetical protein
VEQIDVQFFQQEADDILGKSSKNQNHHFPEHSDIKEKMIRAGLKSSRK